MRKKPFCLLQRMLQYTNQFFVANKLEPRLKGMQNRMKISSTLTKSKLEQMISNFLQNSNVLP